MRSFLTEDERAGLKLQHKKERDKRVCDRIKAILLYDEGWTLAQIARVLLIDDNSVRRHIKEFKLQRKLAPENGGSKESLSRVQARELEAHLEEHTYMFTKDIVHYVEVRFKVSYSIPGMHKWLSRHGFSYKKPTIVPGKANFKVQEAWIQEYEKLKQGLSQKETICFMDGVHPTHNAEAYYGWIRRGIRKDLPTNTGRKRINISGALDLLQTQFHFRKDERLTALSTVEFLKQIEKAYPKMERIHVICDNAGYYKGDAVKEYLSDPETKIKLHFLPPYSPNLNPIERVWKFLKDRVIYNSYYETFSDFENAIFGFLQAIKNLDSSSEFGKAFKSRVRDKFRAISSPLTTSSS